MVMQESTKISERRACQLVGLSRTVLHYESKAQPENEQLQARLVDLAGERAGSAIGACTPWFDGKGSRSITNASIGFTAMPA
jgi:hypothetical protein